MLPELRRYIQHISLSPDSINNDEVCSDGPLGCPVLCQLCQSHHVCNEWILFQAVSPLMKYLQDTMLILTENLVKENLATYVLSSPDTFLFPSHNVTPVLSLPALV